VPKKIKGDAGRNPITDMRSISIKEEVEMPKIDWEESQSHH
jgi:hypothetical protein